VGNELQQFNGHGSFTCLVALSKLRHFSPEVTMLRRMCLPLREVDFFHVLLFVKEVLIGVITEILQAFIQNGFAAAREHGPVQAFSELKQTTVLRVDRIHSHASNP